MDKLIDFSNYNLRVNEYDGAEDKVKIVINGSYYMLKFGNALADDPKKPLQGSYSNMPVSEYIGCHIFDMLKIPVQETVLGLYNSNYAVACKDFILGRHDWQNYKIVPFKSLEKSFLGGSSKVGRTPAYDNVINVFNNHKDLSNVRAAAITRFWQTFIVDALLGNFDRHAGNWGFILDRNTDQIVELAPVYDCGSCLYPKLSKEKMQEFLDYPELLNKRVLEFPTAALSLNNKKVHYHVFLLMDEAKDCRKVLLQLAPKIDLGKINQFIQEIPGVPQVQKDFYVALIKMRHSLILTPAINLAISESTN